MFGGSVASASIARMLCSSQWGRRALALLGVATVALVVVPAAQAALVFDGSPGSGAPPATLGGFTMVPSPQDTRANFTTVTTAPATPTSSFSFSKTMSLRTIGSYATGWCSSNWAGGSYGGRVYWTQGGTSVKITLPSPASAVYLYADPELFGTHTMEATASDGTTASSGPIATATYLCGGTNPPSGQFFGFYGTGGEKIASLTLSVPILGFGVADFALASGTPPAKPTTLTTSLSGEGQKGEHITVKEGSSVTDEAAIAGENAATATGKVTYKVYSDKACTNEVASAGEVTVSAGKVPASEAKTLASGTYYWQASYSGDTNNMRSLSTCGSEVETVTATCGKTTVGATKDGYLADSKRVNACVLPVKATVSELSVYLSPTTHTGQQLIKGIVYADSGGSPAALLGKTMELTFKSTNAPGWYKLPFATPLKLAAGNYWIGVITGATQYIAAEYFDTVANAEDYNSNSYAAGPSDPFGSFKTTNEQMSLYATYTAG
jgi:hypothetical protein